MVRRDDSVIDVEVNHPPPPARRVLVTLHLPLDMRVVGRVMSAVAEGYPSAVVGEDGTIWDRREDPTDG